MDELILLNLNKILKKYINNILIYLNIINLKLSKNYITNCDGLKFVSKFYFYEQFFKLSVILYNFIN